MRILAKAITFEGVGLHSGEHARVSLIPHDKSGYFVRTANGLFSLSEAVVEEDSRLTGFKLPDGTKIRTAEHLLGAIVGMGLEGIIIELDGSEVPILDGSATPFAEGIAKAGYLDVAAEVPNIDLSMPVYIDDDKGRFVAALPSQAFKVTYVIDYTGTGVGVQRVSYAITPEVFLNEISRARTFGLTSELDFLQKAGLAKGGSLDNALMYDGMTLLNEGGLRFPLEPVTHKVTDLLGDLTLLGRVPRAHYIAICAGHEMHGRLVNKLKRLFPSP